MGSFYFCFLYLQIKLRIIYVFLQRKFTTGHTGLHRLSDPLICVSLCNLR